MPSVMIHHSHQPNSSSSCQKHVEDPKSKKKKAQQTNVNSPQQRQQKAKQVKGATATGATGLTADQLKQTRAGLKHHS